MHTVYRNNMAWLHGRETGLPPAVGQQDELSNMLYSSVNVMDFWDPAVSSQDHHGGIFNFDFSTDGAVLVAACEGKSFLVFDPNNHKLLTARRRAHSDCVNCVRFLDTRSFVTCSDDTTVALWDLRFLKNRVQTFEGHSSWVKNIEYAASLGVLITSGFDGAVYSWNINNYSKEEECKRLFYTEGLMRCKLTPDESKLVLSTSRGYLVIIHQLDLPHLNINMDSFKADGNSGPRLRAIINNFNSLFKRPKNRLEIINEFPVKNDAENIASLQVHPHGWCVVSRNTSKDDVTEWTCVHDIHTQPAVTPKQEEDEQNVAQFLLDSSVSPVDSSARTNPPQMTSWGSPSVHRHRPYTVPSVILQPQRINGQGPVERFKSSPGVSVATASALEGGEQDGDSDSSDSDVSAVDRAGNSSEDCTTSSTLNATLTTDLYRYFLRAQWNDLGRTLPMEEAVGRPGSDVDIAEDPVDAEHQEGDQSHGSENWTAPQGRHRARLRFVNRHRTAWGLEHFLRSYYLNDSVPRNTYRSQPRLIYCQQEPNVGQGFIKEQCFSCDGRLIVSPCGNGVRLLAFDERCRELCDCEPFVAGKPRPLQKVRELRMHPHVVLTTRFSPTHLLFVSGSRDGSVAFMTPNP